MVLVFILMQLPPDRTTAGWTGLSVHERTQSRSLLTAALYTEERYCAPLGGTDAVLLRCSNANET